MGQENEFNISQISSWKEDHSFHSHNYDVAMTMWSGQLFVVTNWNHWL